MFDWQIVITHLPDLLRATVRTIQLTLWTVLLGTVLGVALAIVRQSAAPMLGRAIAVYSWFMRTGPLLVILYFLYYGLPRVGIYLPAFQLAVLGGGVASGAYYMEIIRGGILAVPKGQMDAARALGMHPLRVWTRVVLPQAIPVFLPPFVSNTQLILKGSSLAGVITVAELTGVGNRFISLTFRPLEILFPVAVIYLTLNSVLVLLQMAGERAWHTRR